MQPPPPKTLSWRSAARLGLTVPMRALAAFAATFVVGLIPGIAWADSNSGNEDATTIALAWISFASFVVFTVACLALAYWHKR